MKKLLDLFLKVNELQLVHRYDLFPEFVENTSAHTFKVVMYVDYLYRYLNLVDLDYQKCIELALYHDFCEIGEKADIDAHVSGTNKEMAKLKEEKENSVIHSLAQKYDAKIKTFFDEYEEKQSKEAIFVTVCDKIDGCLHVIWQEADYIPNHEWFATYADKTMLLFPAIWPLYEKIKELTKERYLELGYEWKEEYDAWKGIALKKD